MLLSSKVEPIKQIVSIMVDGVRQKSMPFICRNCFVKITPGVQHIDKKMWCNGRNNIPIQIVEKLRTIGQVSPRSSLATQAGQQCRYQNSAEFFCNFRYRHFICFNGIYWGGFRIGVMIGSVNSILHIQSCPNRKLLLVNTK